MNLVSILLHMMASFHSYMKTNNLSSKKLQLMDNTYRPGAMLIVFVKHVSSSYKWGNLALRRRTVFQLKMDTALMVKHNMITYITLCCSEKS